MTQYKRERDRRYDERLKAAGLCRRCIQPRGDTGTTTMCRPCADAECVRAAANYAAMPFRQYAERRMRDRRAKALIRQKERSR